MAKPKQKILIEVFHRGGEMHIWSSDKEQDATTIKDIEGVDAVFTRQTMNLISVYVDPRYDINEIATEIEALLTAEVPPIFRENSQP